MDKPVSRSKLSRFKTRQLLLLDGLEIELMSKYNGDPAKVDEIRNTIERLRNKLRYLRYNGLFSYVFMVMEISRKYPEFKVLLSTVEETIT